MTDIDIFYKIERNGFSEIFETKKDFEDWIEGIKNDWSTFEINFRTIDQLLRSSNQQSVKQIEAQIDSIITKIFPNTNSRYSFLMDLKSKNSDQAKGAYRYFFNGRETQHSPNQIFGMIAAYQFEKGEKQEEHNHSANNILRERTNEVVTQCKQEIIQQKEEIENLKNQIKSLLDEKNIEFKNNSEQVDREINSKLDDAKNLIDKTTKEYREQFSLKAPVEYWQSKKRNHWLAVFVLSTIVGIISTIGCHIVFDNLDNLNHTSIIDTSVSGINTRKEKSWIEIVGSSLVAKISQKDSLKTILLAFLLVWLIRFLVKIILSNIHLATDASERAVMTKTFLALNSESKIDTKSHQSLILEALFRPSPNGLIKDDGIPPSIFSALSKIK